MTAEQVCQPQDAHIQASTPTVPISGTDYFVGYCVKAGSANQGLGPEYVWFELPLSTFTIAHSSGKDISHYVLFPATTTTPSTTVTVTTTTPPPATTVPEAAPVPPPVDTTTTVTETAPPPVSVPPTLPATGADTGALGMAALGLSLVLAGASLIRRARA